MGRIAEPARTRMPCLLGVCYDKKGQNNIHTYIIISKMLANAVICSSVMAVKCACSRSCELSVMSPLKYNTTLPASQKVDYYCLGNGNTFHNTYTHSKLVLSL